MEDGTGRGRSGWAEGPIWVIGLFPSSPEGQTRLRFSRLRQGRGGVDLQSGVKGVDLLGLQRERECK